MVFSRSSPAWVMLIWYSLLSVGDCNTAIHFLATSFLTMRVTLELGAIMRERISFWHMLFGWLPLRMRNTLNCSCVTLKGFRWAENLLYNQFAVNSTLILAFTNSLSNLGCFNSFSKEAMGSKAGTNIQHISCIYNYFGKKRVRALRGTYSAGNVGVAIRGRCPRLYDALTGQENGWAVSVGAAHGCV